ncbi:hypothetical protein D3C81_1303870 [compost metagenome]
MLLTVQDLIRTGRSRIFRIEIEIGVHRIVEIQQRHGVVVAEPGVDVVTHTHKVNADQQGVVNGTGRKFALQLGIHGEVLQLLIINHVFTRQIMTFVRRR